MSQRALWRTGLALVAILAILTPLAGAVLFDLWLSLTEHRASATGSPLGLNNYVSILHTVIFRKAATNSLLLILVVVPVSISLGSLLANSLAHTRFSRRATLGLLLIPLLVPPAVASLAWRAPLAGLLLMRETSSALFMIGVVLLWRTLPLVTGILYGTRDHEFRWRPYLIAALTVTAIVLLDASSALMLTGGEPSNTSQTWASWLFQNVWVSRNWGQAAAMSILLATAVALVAAGLAWLTISQPMNLRLIENSRRHTSRSHTLIILLGNAFILLPVFSALRAASAGPLSGFSALLRAGFIGWMANTLLVVVVTTLLATLLILMAAPHIARLPVQTRRTLGAAALVAGAAILPIWIVPLVWLQDGGRLGDGRLALSIVFATIVASVSLWPSTGIWRQAAPRRQRVVQTIGLTGALSLFCLIQDFGSAVAVNNGPRTALLGSGFALYLARDATTPSAPALATLIIFGLAGLFGIILVRMTTSPR